MEGVGARLGRLSSRYGSTTVFSGPVRRWKKKWVHVSSFNSANHTSQANGGNGNNGSHLLLYKWTAISQNTNNNGDKNGNKDDIPAGTATGEPPRRKFRYVPSVVVEDRKESAEKIDEEVKPSETDLSTGTISKNEGCDDERDTNDVPMEKNQASGKDQLTQRDMSETSLDLSLGLKAHDGDRDSDSKTVNLSK